MVIKYETSLTLSGNRAKGSVNVNPRLQLHRVSAAPQRIVASTSVTWESAKVSDVNKAAEGLHVLKVDLGSAAGGYKSAGQFIQMRVLDKKPGFFAIASPPAQENQAVEVLVKDAGPETTAYELCRMMPGSSAEITAVMGKGFRPERAPPSDYPTCLMFATGSGISPIKALIESDELQASDRQQVVLYYGTRNPSTTAYQQQQNQWEGLGVRTVNVFSDDGKGYVQDVFAKDLPQLDGSKTCAVLVGHKEMCEAVSKLLEERGVSKDKILMNF